MSTETLAAEVFRGTEVGNLPENWSVVELGELFEVQQGKALSQAARLGPSPRRFLRTANVRWGRFDLTKLDQMNFSSEEAERLSLQPGDLLVCEGGEIGRAALWKQPNYGYSFQNHLHRLRAKSAEVDPGFVMYWLQAAFMYLGVYAGVGNRTTIPNLSSTRLKRLAVPQPPSAEQRAIASILSKLQSAVEVQDKIVARLKELKTATMAKLFREGVRGEPLKQTEIGEIPESWEVVPIGELFHIQLGKMLSPKARGGLDPKPYLRNANVQWGRFDLSDLYEMDFSPAERERFALRPGDLLVCEGGEVGRTALWHGEVEPCFYQKALLRLRPKDPAVVLPAYYLYWAEAAFTVFRTHGVEGTATTIAHLPAVKLAAMSMALPSLGDQDSIVLALGSIDSGIRQAGTRLAALQRLFISVLHSLMTGRVRVRSL